MTEQHTRPKFEFADGLRGLAALAVAVLHATTFTGRVGAVDDELPILGSIARIGDYAVPVFIVLSGYVLTLPVFRGDGRTLRGGFWDYVRRRARRILPPYYASLVLFIVLIALIPVLQTRQGTAWDNKIPVTLEGVLTHLLLIHIWNPEWAYQINGPAWSVATEWHIYFLLPLALLPLRRLIGVWGTIAVALMLGPAITYFLPTTTSGRYWLIGLFALGMLAASLTIRPPRLRTGWLSVIVLVTTLAWTTVNRPDALPERMIADTMVGVGVALALIAMGTASMRSRMNPGRRVFEWRPLVNTGLWSYSIYLIHSPLLALANLLLIPLALPTLAHWLSMVFVALPLALVASYGFFLLVERHFTTSHQKRELGMKQEPAESSSGTR
ncbi:acyltransferase [Microbacterium betulae]|uniref:Acyltransferase n=1 Tax=Microbacterium betulae TaxID=2981139 RepID=A0AA97FE29_9MICO|nr:acyltransferase [Microbacterium sp. AB]WOF21801.1 acyltransferase [Microbacterium sp. AB]